MKQTFHNARTSVCPVCYCVPGADCVQDEQGLHLEKFCLEHGVFTTCMAAGHDWLGERRQSK
ncbi:MAG: hypothetical protein ACYTBJ_16865 [Planctomycetota bacterium]